MTAPRLRPLLTPPNDGTQTEDKLDVRVALKKGAGQPFTRNLSNPSLSATVPTPVGETHFICEHPN